MCEHKLWIILPPEIIRAARLNPVQPPRCAQSPREAPASPPAAALLGVRPTRRQNKQAPEGAGGTAGGGHLGTDSTRTSHNKDLNELFTQSFKARVFAPWTAVSLPARLREALERAQSPVSAPSRAWWVTHGLHPLSFSLLVFQALLDANSSSKHPPKWAL